MKLRFSFVAALAATLAVTATVPRAGAQSRSTSFYNSGYRVAANTAPAAEELPSRMSAPATMQAPPAAQAMPDVNYMSNGYSQGGCQGGCNDGCCDSGCCENYGCCDSCGGGGCCGNGQMFVFADYLLVQSNFSESTAFIRQDLGAGNDYFVPFDFDYDSSYRVGGGWRNCGCGDAIRFMYTRLASDAETTAFPGDIVPFSADPPPDGRTDITADVTARLYDLECVKIIPLGGQCGGGCGDACGCGDCCGKSCPAWDISWSGGIRWGDIGWNRRYQAFDDTNFEVTDARTGMVFHGGGLRTGLEGRRYFFCDGWLSIYGKGNISLLLGDVHMNTSRESDSGATFVSQTFVNREIIPVTELEAGLTAQVSCHCAFTAGYLFTGFHDLGFRNAIDVCDCDDGATVSPLLATHHDDANILGFNGLFIRAEYGF